MHGYGTLTLKNGKTFAGNFVNGVLEDEEEIANEEKAWMEAKLEDEEDKLDRDDDMQSIRAEERLIYMRDSDQYLAKWVYTLEGINRADEALQYLDDNPQRISVWINERRT